MQVADSTVEPHPSPSSAPLHRQAYLVFWLWAIAPVPEVDVDTGEVIRVALGAAPEVVGRNARVLAVTEAALAPAMRELRLVALSPEEALNLLLPRDRLRVIA